jgi:glyoxylase-like metal-dependent hydrolase (beta-lactamase superfamily II)
MLKKCVKVLTSHHHETFPSANFKGTNCFILGTKDKRVMIDAGAFPQVDPEFIPQLTELMEKEKFSIQRIFITQYKACHWGGAQAIVDLHQ